MVMVVGIVILVLIQIVFAFACVNEVKRKGQLSNWWVLAAATIPILPYILARRLPLKEK
jgi:hypothetical protein